MSQKLDDAKYADNEYESCGAPAVRYWPLEFWLLCRSALHMARPNMLPNTEGPKPHIQGAKPAPI